MFSSRTVASPTFANVCVDEMVGATGFRSGRVITATDVMIWSTVPDDFAAFGMVISVERLHRDGRLRHGRCGRHVHGAAPQPPAEGRERHARNDVPG